MAKECMNHCVLDAIAGDWSNVASEKVQDLVEAIEDCDSDGGVVFIAGNGGSAANANHMAEDLGLRGYRAMSLSANAAEITAIGNDFGYYSVFSHQIIMKSTGSDILVVFSVSGTSRNVVVAIATAHYMGIPVYAFFKEHKGTCYELCHKCYEVGGVTAAYVETCHAAWLHVVTQSLEDRFDKKLRAVVGDEEYKKIMRLSK